MQEEPNFDHFDNLRRDSSTQEQNQGEYTEISNTSDEDFEAGVLAQLDSLYRTALRMTNNTQEAEDLVQETMLKAFRFAHRQCLRHFVLHTPTNQAQICVHGSSAF